ncbi:MAG: hypothetical protein IPL53_04570 [Ignavibacteria bacterium]|nr:hypothetical protein [Ignavibacteria bacterium]
MKFRFLIFLILSVIYSCGNNNEQIESRPDLSKANKIKFDFKTDFDSTNKINIKSVEVGDLKNVSQVKNIITYDPFTYIYCTSTGSMSFYKDSTLLVTMVFNTIPDQKHIAFTYNGKFLAMNLSEENARFLESLKN